MISFEEFLNGGGGLVLLVVLSKGLDQVHLELVTPPDKKSSDERLNLDSCSCLNPEQNLAPESSIVLFVKNLSSGLSHSNFLQKLEHSEVPLNFDCTSSKHDEFPSVDKSFHPIFSENFFLDQSSSFSVNEFDLEVTLHSL